MAMLSSIRGFACLFCYVEDMLIMLVGALEAEMLMLKSCVEDTHSLRIGK